MRRIVISTVLTCTLIVTSATMAFAQTASLENDNAQTSYALLEDVGTIQNYQKQGDLETYNVEFENGTVSNVEVVTSKNGDMTYNITEGQLSNEVIVQTDGTVILDGNEVRLEETVEPSTNMTLRSTYSYETETSPIGTQYDYQKYVGQTKKADLRLGNVASAITFAAFCVILEVVFKIPTAVSFVIGVVYDALVTYTPYSNAISYVQTSYYHNNSASGGLMGGRVIQKRVTQFYGNTNFVSFLGETVTYLVTEL